MVHQHRAVRDIRRRQDRPAAPIARDLRLGRHRHGRDYAAIPRVPRAAPRNADR